MIKSITVFFLKNIVYFWIKTLRKEPILLPPTPCILLGLHEESVVSVSLIPDLYALVSRSNDGDILSWLFNKLGVKLVRGSTNNGGHRAISLLLQSLRNCPEQRICTSLDGPRGPRRKFQLGFITLAKRTGVPLYICRAYYKGWRLQSSWDKHLIPLPLSRVKVIFSRPFYIDRKEDTKVVAQMLEKEITKMDINLSSKKNS